MSARCDLLILKIQLLRWVNECYAGYSHFHVNETNEFDVFVRYESGTLPHVEWDMKKLLIKSTDI